MNGVLVSKSRGEFVEQQPNSSIYRHTESNADGTESMAESIETTDPKKMAPIMSASARLTEPRSKTDTLPRRRATPTRRAMHNAQGHLTEVIEESDSHYSTYSFDKDGRPIGQINYNDTE